MICKNNIFINTLSERDITLVRVYFYLEKGWARQTPWTNDKTDWERLKKNECFATLEDARIAQKLYKRIKRQKIYYKNIFKNCTTYLCNISENTNIDKC